MIQKTQQLSSGRRKGTTLHSPFASNTEVIKLCVETISVEDYKKYKEDLYGANKNGRPHFARLETAETYSYSTYTQRISSYQSSFSSVTLS